MLAPVGIKIKKLLHCMYRACTIVTYCDCEFNHFLNGSVLDDGIVSSINDPLARILILLFVMNHLPNAGPSSLSHYL